MNYYIECSFCGEITKVFADSIEELDEKLESMGYIINNVMEDVYYVCPKCVRRAS